MSIILELREHLSHAGIPSVHPASEDVLLSSVFGVMKNLPDKYAQTPWLRSVTGISVAEARWAISFWEKQQRPIGIREGNTIVDLVLNTNETLVFVEVKMDAPTSFGTAPNPNRNQLERNLDIGYSAIPNQVLRGTYLPTSLKSGSGRIVSTMKQVFTPTSCTGAGGVTLRRPTIRAVTGRAVPWLARQVVGRIGTLRIFAEPALGRQGSLESARR